VSIEVAREKIALWRRDPLRFAVDELKMQPDKWQEESLREFGNPANQRMGWKACKGPGKTALLAVLNWNFLATRPHPKMAATSITEDNLADCFWSEMAKWQGRSKFLKEAFQWNKTRIFAKHHPETWFLSARTWSKKADPQQQADALAGIHADYTMFTLDESGGIPQAVMTTAEAALAAGKECRVLQAGNPTHLEGPLYRACTLDKHLWWMREITGDPADPMRSPRVSIKWAQDQIDSYGKDNPWVLVNVFGRFPPSSLNVLLGPDEVRDAMKRHLRIEEYNWSQKRIGIDVARFGDDLTVLFPRQGLAAFRPIPMRHPRNSAVSVEIASKVMFSKNKWGSEMEFFDDTVGWAHGAIDVMRAAGHSPTPVVYNNPADNPRYKNKRAEMWLKMADWVKAGGALPNIPELVAELTIPTYTFVGGQFVMEEKDQIKKRMGRSPNFADALANTFAIPDLPASNVFPAGMLQQYANNYHKNEDYNPYDPDRI